MAKLQWDIWRVDYQNKIGVFKNHATKRKLYMPWGADKFLRRAFTGKARAIEYRKVVMARYINKRRIAIEADLMDRSGFEISEHIVEEAVIDEGLRQQDTN